MCAALGISQLSRIDTLISHRRTNAKEYRNRLKGISEITIPEEPAPVYHTYQMFSILINEGRYKRDMLKQHLLNHGISSKVYFEPIHRTKFYQHDLGYSDDLPNTNWASEHVLTMPIFPGLTLEELIFVCDCVGDFFG